MRLWPVGLNWHFRAKTDLLNFQCPCILILLSRCQVIYLRSVIVLVKGKN